MGRICLNIVKILVYSLRLCRVIAGTIALTIFRMLYHNQEGNPSDNLRYENNANFNMGLDGISPLIAGICNENQKKDYELFDV